MRSSGSAHTLTATRPLARLACLKIRHQNRRSIPVRSRMAIAFLGITMAIVQIFDGIIGALVHDPSKPYGPFAFAVLNALAVGF
jgi:hypothetical protein